MVNDLEDLLDDLDECATIFQWQCHELISTDLNATTTAPSSRWVGLLGSKKYDQFVIEKPYELEPDYIAPFKVGIGK